MSKYLIQYLLKKLSINKTGWNYKNLILTSTINGLHKLKTEFSLKSERSPSRLHPYPNKISTTITFLRNFTTSMFKLLPRRIVHTLSQQCIEFKAKTSLSLGAIRGGLSHRESMNQLMILLVAIIGIFETTDG